jgi:hypothetical protein
LDKLKIKKLNPDNKKKINLKYKKSKFKPQMRLIDEFQVYKNKKKRFLVPIII